MPPKGHPIRPQDFKPPIGFSFYDLRITNYDHSRLYDLRMLTKGHLLRPQEQANQRLIFATSGSIATNGFTLTTADSPLRPQIHPHDLRITNPKLSPTNGSPVFDRRITVTTSGRRLKRPNQVVPLNNVFIYFMLFNFFPQFIRYGKSVKKPTSFLNRVPGSFLKGSSFLLEEFPPS